MPKPKNRQQQLREKVEYWAGRVKANPRIIRVQKMTRKWGSCSTRGIITLADDLADQPAGFQDFVIAHELLHLRVPSHGRVFKALMSIHVPNWKEYETAK